MMKAACSVEKRVAISLWFLSPGSDYRPVGHSFGVSKSLECVVVQKVCNTIVKVEALKVVIDGFKHKLGYPQCVGVIDGSHIPIISSRNYPADYYNRKGFHSIILQGTVNHIGQFIAINIGWPGRVHDACVFVNPSLYQLCQSGTLLPQWTEKNNVGSPHKKRTFKKATHSIFP